MATTIPSYPFTWQQGEDGEINAVYKENGVAVNLTGYKLRMDIRSATGSLLMTLNSDDIVEIPAVDTTGATDNEVTLGSDGSIHVFISRLSSLGEGPLVSSVGQALPFDMFLRDTNNRQRKILKGTVTFEASQTKWT